MKRHLDNRVWLLALVVLALGLAAACSSSNNSTSNDGGSTPDALTGG